MDDHPAPPFDQLAALTAELPALKPKPPAVTMKIQLLSGQCLTSMISSNSSNESLTSWFHLQGVPAEPGDNGDQIENALNFLGTTGCR